MSCLHNLPNPTVEKIGHQRRPYCQRHPYLQVQRNIHIYNSRFDSSIMKICFRKSRGLKNESGKPQVQMYIHLLSQPKNTEDRLQILYGQYLILGVVCFRPKNQRFLQEKYPTTLSHEQGTHSAKIVPIVWLKIAKMPPKISAQFVCPSPKVSNFRKKSSLWMSVVRVHN